MKMPLLSFEDFFGLSIEKEGRLLGCDVGTKTIGLALSDKMRTIATPLSVIHRTQWKKDSIILFKEIDAHSIWGVVIGFPLNMNGSEGPRCQSTRQFVSNLLNIRDLPICLWDERMSTLAVTRIFMEADLSRAKRAKIIDKAAACYILQGFLDTLKTFQKRT
jgi:putative holliday junction resolvase